MSVLALEKVLIVFQQFSKPNNVIAEHCPMILFCTFYAMYNDTPQLRETSVITVIVNIANKLIFVFVALIVKHPHIYLHILEDILHDFFRSQLIDVCHNLTWKQIKVSLLWWLLFGNNCKLKAFHGTSFNTHGGDYGGG